MPDIDVTQLGVVIQYFATTIGAAFWMVFVSLLVRSLMRAEQDKLNGFWRPIAAWLLARSKPTLFIVVGLVSFSVPLGATLIVAFVPPEVIATIQPFYEQAIIWIAIFGGAFMGQQWLYHKVLKFPLPVIELPDDFFGGGDDEEITTLPVPEAAERHRPAA